MNIPTPPSAASILIVEDSAIQSLLLRRRLEKNGFEVTAEPNGRAALECLATLRPALVITDIQMPEMDGYELCRRIKADPRLRALPVVLLTSLSAPQDIIHGLECGADNFVVKPYTEAFLLSRLRAILEESDTDRGDEGGVAVSFAGQRYVIHSDRRQILHLLLSTYETAVETNRELIRAHEEIKAAQAQLIEAEKLQSIGRLAAGVAHEVRNPLAILEMGTAFLAEKPLGEDGQLIISEMQQAVRRANEVIVRLMDSSSPAQMGMCVADLNGIIKQALATVEPQLLRNRVRLEQQLTPDLPASLVDARKLEQVFINLFTNAAQAMPAGGTLRIDSRVRNLRADEVAFDPGARRAEQLHAAEQAIVIEVRDSGHGIAPEHLGRVFDPFFTTKPTGQGTGLGLTVARKIVELHHGRMQLRNHEEGGVAVTLIFKLA